MWLHIFKEIKTHLIKVLSIVKLIEIYKFYLYFDIKNKNFILWTTYRLLFIVLKHFLDA